MSTGHAVAVLTPLQNSHAFDERRLSLVEEPLKVGRAVARVRPALDNAIFDCKVLSRAHATIWYEDGKFYLKDTKSSNGTFVNNSRLSKGGEESAPTEVHSGDIIQFGVEIVENLNKVTHGCIIAIVRLFHADGREAASTEGRSRTNSTSSGTSTVLGTQGGAAQSHTQQPSISALACKPNELAAAAAAAGHVLMTHAELFQLHQYIKEAAYREQMLDQKLSALSTTVDTGLNAAQDSWQALIDEDRLLSRIEMLHGQLEAHSKTATEDKLRDEMVQMHHDKEKYETAAKESVRRALEEKIEAGSKLADVERSLETSVEKCQRAEDLAQLARRQLEQAEERHKKLLEETRIEQDRWGAEVKRLEESLSETQGRYLVAESEREKLAKQLEKLQQEKSNDSDKDNEVSEKRMASDFAEAAGTPAEQIEKLKAELRDRDAKISYLSAQKDKLTESTHSDDSHSAAVLHSELNDMITNSATVEQIQNRLNDWAARATSAENDKAAGNDYEEQMSKATQAARMLELEVAQYKEQLESAVARRAALDDELSAVRNSLDNQHQLMEDKDNQIKVAQQQLESERANKVKAYNDISGLKEQLEEVHQRLDEVLSENERLKRVLENVGNQQTPDDAVKPPTESATKQQKSPSPVGKSADENEQTTDKQTSADNSAAYERQAARNEAEFALFREECAQLRTRLQTIDAEMKSLRKENHRLTSANKQQLEELCTLQQSREALEKSEGASRQAAIAANDEKMLLLSQLEQSRADATRLSSERHELQQNLSQSIAGDTSAAGASLSAMFGDNGNDSGPLDVSAVQLNTVALLGVLPFAMILLAVILCYLPFFASFTGTVDVLVHPDSNVEL